MTTPRHGPSDFRFTAFDFDPTKYDAMMSSLDTVKDRLKGISELRNVRVVRTLKNRMMVMAGYGRKKQWKRRQKRTVQYLLTSLST